MKTSKLMQALGNWTTMSPRMWKRHVHQGWWKPKFKVQCVVSYQATWKKGKLASPTRTCTYIILCNSRKLRTRNEVRSLRYFYVECEWRVVHAFTICGSQIYKVQFSGIHTVLYLRTNVSIKRVNVEKDFMRKACACTCLCQRFHGFDDLR